MVDFGRNAAPRREIRKFNLLAAAVTPDSIVRWLTSDDFAATFSALVLIALLGMILVLTVVVWARHVRRLNRRPVSPSQMATDRWYEKPLVDPASKLPSDEVSDVE